MPISFVPVLDPQTNGKEGRECEKQHNLRNIQKVPTTKVFN